MPKLSIITICRNEGQKITKTIESVINQSFKDYEYILIDGASTDDTLDRIKPWQSQITRLVSEPDFGIYNAQNKGICLSSGTYLLFLNGGDYLADSEVLTRIFDQNLDSDIIYGDMRIVDDAGSHIEGKSPPVITLKHMLRSTLWHPVSFIRKELFDKFGKYDESFKIVADYDFFLKVICVEGVTTEYRPITVSVFNTQGIGSSKDHEKVHQAERERAQLKYFPRSVLSMYDELVDLEGRYEQVYASVPAGFFRWLNRWPILKRILFKSCWVLRKILPA